MVMAAVTETTTVPSREAGAGAPVPVMNGDYLTQAEFFRRCTGRTHLKDAELIEGIVYLPSPVSHGLHGAPHFDLVGWLGLYQMHTSDICGGANGTLCLDDLNAPRADAYLIVLPSHGGQVSIDAQGYIVGAPELVAEVAASSAAIDLHGKLAAYLRNGVREYVVWRVYDRAIDWFVSRSGRFDRLTPKGDGHFESEVLPGSWLDPAALIAGDMLAVARTVQQGIDSPEHAAFVARLQQAAQTRPGPPAPANRPPA
jgi:hypothetical protein